MPLSKDSIIFVTGASGFVAFQIVVQLLEAGYRVRGAARGKKYHGLKKAFAKSPRFEAVEVSDVTKGDLSKAFKGVSALIHCAAYMPGKSDAATSLKLAAEGTLHVLEAAKTAGIKRVAVTGSLVSYPEKGPCRLPDYHPVTYKEALSSNDAWVVYVAEKKFTEVAVIDWATKNPDISVALMQFDYILTSSLPATPTVSPNYIFGPLAPGFDFIVPDFDPRGLSSNGLFYMLLIPKNENFPMAPGVTDIRDVARLHIAAVESDKVAALPPQLRRFPAVSPDQSDYRVALKLIAEERPELKDRLSSIDKAPVWPTYTVANEGLKHIEEVLDIPVNSYRPWRETVLDTIDSLVVLEKIWKAKA
ncbi:NAD(P)-binding protein [Fistulina hepatica ATCC 64428]|uniref:NAD(P)-binding protein n=1 Tax=Fistulina hepatica ATCC 64428 TaxID=1128425 RepID=A0A0D7ACF2_9AGAR|nr:NAD(P)-binding protein [Fistulina hepatica ATCC 64428]